jgi:(2Fe-2S) ferredoxin
MYHKKAKGIFTLIVLLSGSTYAAVNHAAAEQIVMAQLCKDGATVEQLLDKELKPSHRDLGWRVFARDEGFDVERAFLVSKSMELRYRWRVDAAGRGQAVSERAQKLCS